MENQSTYYKICKALNKESIAKEIIVIQKGGTTNNSINTINKENIAKEIIATQKGGTGKTTLSKLLSEYVDNLKHINIGELVLEKKLYKEWDDDFNLPIFDEDMLCDELENIM